MFKALARLIRRNPAQLIRLIADDLGVSLVLEHGETEPQFAWAAVVEVRTYKRDLGTVDAIHLAFQVGSDWHDLGEDINGFMDLADAMSKALPAHSQQLVHRGNAAGICHQRASAF